MNAMEEAERERERVSDAVQGAARVAARGRGRTAPPQRVQVGRKERMGE